jgi:hypothetical protein
VSPLDHSLSPSPTPLPLCPSPRQSPSACATAQRCRRPPLTLSCCPKGSAEIAGWHGRRDSPPSPPLEGAAAGAPPPLSTTSAAARTPPPLLHGPRPRPHPLVSTAGARAGSALHLSALRATRQRDVMATAASSLVPWKAEGRHRKLEQRPRRPAWGGLHGGGIDEWGRLRAARVRE